MHIRCSRVLLTLVRTRSGSWQQRLDLYFRKRTFDAKTRGCGHRLLLILLAISVASAQDHVASQYEAHIYKGNLALKSSNWQLAEQEYRAALTLNASSPELLSNLGLACYFQQHPEEAKQEFQKALELNKDLFVPNLFLGIVFHRRGEFVKASHFLSKATRLKPDEGDALYWLGLNLGNAGHYEAGVKNLHLAIDRGTSNAEAFYHLGKFYSKLAGESFERSAQVSADGDVWTHLVAARKFQAAGDTSSARRHYLAVRSKQPESKRLSLELGNLRLATGDWTAAISDFQSELKIDPKSYESFIGLAQAYLNLADLKKSLGHLHHAIEIRPEFFSPAPPAVIALPEEKVGELLRDTQLLESDGNVAAVLLSIWLAERLKDQARIETSTERFEDLRRALIARLPVAPVKSRQDADNLLLRKRFEAAARGFSTLKDWNRSDRTLELPLAEALFESGKYREAGVALKLYLVVFPANGLAHFRLGLCYEKLAVEALGQIAKIDARSYRIHQLLAESSLERSDWETAAHEFRNALALHPNDSELYFGLGRASLKAGKTSDATEHFQKALLLNPFDSFTNYAIGLTYSLDKKPDEAIPYFKAALRTDPNRQDAREQLGRSLVKLGNHAEAVPELEAAAAVDTDGSVHYLLYVCYRKLEQQEKAKVALKASQQLKTASQTKVAFEMGYGTESPRP